MDSEWIFVLCYSEVKPVTVICQCRAFISILDIASLLPFYFLCGSCLCLYFPCATLHFICTNEYIWINVYFTVDQDHLQYRCKIDNCASCVALNRIKACREFHQFLTFDPMLSLMLAVFCYPRNQHWSFCLCPNT